MPRLTNKDSFFGTIFGNWNDGTSTTHSHTTFENKDLGIRHPRHAYVNLGQVKAASPLSGGVGGLTDDAAVGASNYPMRDQRNANPLIAPSGDVTVTMINTGSTTWSATYELRETTGTFSIPPIPTGTTVAPGASHTFNITVAGSTVPTPPPPTLGLLDALNFELQMYDGPGGGGTAFGGTTGFYQVNPWVGMSSQVPNPRIPSGSGVNILKYKIQAFNQAGECIHESEEATQGGVHDFSAGQVVEVDSAFIPNAVRYELWRTDNLQDPVIGIGRVHAADLVSPTAYNPDPLATSFYLTDRGPIDQPGTPPPCTLSSSKGKIREQELAAPNLVNTNILDGVLADGSAGGQVINGEVVFNYVDLTFPHDETNWPTADWPRDVTVFLDADPSEPSPFMRVIGEDGWGDEVGLRVQFRINEVQSFRFAFKKIKKIVFEGITNKIRIYLGWGTALGLPFPVHPMPQQAAGGFGSVNRYHPRFFRAGQDLGQTSVAGLDRVLVSPRVFDRRGLWVPAVAPLGNAVYEIEYWVENNESNISTEWSVQNAAGNVPLVTS